MKKMHVRKPAKSEIDGTDTWGTWSHAVATFTWSYDEKETCYILEGEANVTDSEGNNIQFTAGDWVIFEQGVTCTWNITKNIRKKYRFG